MGHSDPFSSSCNPIPDSSCSLLLRVTGITARWLSDPSKGGCGGGGRFPQPAKRDMEGDTAGKVREGEGRERPQISHTPDTATGGSKAWLCLGKRSPALGTLSPGSNLPCNSVLSDLWQVTWLRLLVCTGVAMRINEAGRAKCCEHLPLLGFKKPPLAVEGVPRTSEQTAVRCQGCSPRVSPFSLLLLMLSTASPQPRHLSLFQSKALKRLSLDCKG